MNGLPAQEAAYILAAIALITGLMQFIKPLLERIPALSPTSPDQALHDAVLRGVSFLLNVGAVIASEATLNTLDWHNWLTYITIAAGGALGAHGLFSLVNGQAGDATAAPTTATPVPPTETPPATSALPSNV